MPHTSKIAAMASGLLVALAAATLGQANPQSGPETLAVPGGTVEWIEKSDVSAFQEGVLDRMELEVGDVVERGGTIGTLHDEIARLAVKKAEVGASGVAEVAKAQAQEELAIAVLATTNRLRSIDIRHVSREEVQKNEAEVKVAAAMVLEAKERQKLYQAELELAQRALAEHTITAPFDGVITERYKHPGESVRANEPVVRIGEVGRLRLFVWIPIEYAYRVRVGAPVEVTPNIANAVLPIEQKKFRGKITFVDPEVSPNKHEVRIFAEVENSPEHELRPGLTADMVIMLNAAPAPAVGARVATQPR